MHLSGLYTNLITPFHNGDIDIPSISRLIALQLEHNINGLVVLSELSEELSLSQQEYENILKAIIELTSQKIPVISGVGRLSTNDAVDKAMMAERLGASGIIVSPSIFPNLTEEACFERYSAISSSVNIPIIISDGLTNSETRLTRLSNRLIERLMSFRNIVGFHNTQGDLEQALWFSTNFSEDKKAQFLGKDSVSIAFHMYGGTNLISSTSNVIPDICVTLHGLLSSQQYDEAIKLQKLLLPFHQFMDASNGPASIKYVAYLFDIIESYEVKAPSSPVSKDEQRAILEIINKLQNII